MLSGSLLGKVDKAVRPPRRHFNLPQLPTIVNRCGILGACLIGVQAQTSVTSLQVQQRRASFVLTGETRNRDCLAKQRTWQ